MKSTIYLPARHYSSSLIKQMRADLWKVDHYIDIWGIYTADLVVPFIKHSNKAFLENLMELHGIDVLVGTPEQTVNLCLTSGDDPIVEIPFTSPFGVERKTSGGMDTEVRKTYRPTFDFETL